VGGRLGFAALTLFFLAFVVGCGGGDAAVPSDPAVPPVPVPAPAKLTGVLTWHGDNARTGAFTNETILNPRNVNPAQFGKVFSFQVDGEVYAQPLYVANLDIPAQGTHNVLFIATEHDTVYAFDADGKSTTPLWKTSFIDPARGITTMPVGDERDYNCCFSPEIGITGTPVIDPGRGTIYLVAETVESGEVIQRLHALDIRTGAERSGSPVRITASVAGNTSDSQLGQVSFLPQHANQRPGLLLINGIVYIAWGSHNDRVPYHGWVMSYSADTLQQLGVFLATPQGNGGGITAAGGGGIWMSGGAPSADSAGNVHVVTGNGAFNADSGGSSYSQSFIKLASTSGVLSVADWFTPHDGVAMNVGDMDLGSSSPLLIDQAGAPHPHLVVSAGKNGTIYVVDRDSMGHLRDNDDSQIVQAMTNALATFVRCSPAFWNNTLYFSSLDDTLKAFKLSNGMLLTTPSSKSQHVFPFPGPTPSVSANGTTDGVVWALQHSGGPAVLYAFDANDLGKELYNSSRAGSRDQGPPSIRFAVPVIANGRVYIGGRGLVTAYGLLAP
jgi:hypothetical protein